MRLIRRHTTTTYEWIGDELPGTFHRVRRVVLWALAAAIWVSVFGLVRGATGEPRSRCDDFTGDIRPPIACLDNGASVLPALPIASAVAAVVVVGGLAWIRRREDEPQ